MAQKHVFGANMKIGLVAESTKYGTKGSSATIGVSGLFPADWTESVSKEIIYKDRGQIGLSGEKQAGLAIGQTVAGGLTGSMYFSSGPILTCMAMAMGEETTSGFGAQFAHDFRWGENFYNSNNANGGTLERHATLGIDAGIDFPSGSDDLVFVCQSFKPSSMELSIERDTGMMGTFTGTAYLCTRTDLDTDAWSDISDRNELILTGNHCTMTTYVAQYSASKTMGAGDIIRPQNVTLTFDQSNDAIPDTATGLGIAEPTFTPTGRSVKVAWTQDFGNDDTDYGQRDFTSEYQASTPLGFYMTIVSTGDDRFEFRAPRMLLDGPGKPIVDGPDVIGMSYTATCFVPEQSLSNTFAGLDNNSADIKIVNDVSGTYMNIA